MENNQKLPTNCPYCGELVNYLNHKHHLYMYCTEEKLETLLDAVEYKEIVKDKPEKKKNEFLLEHVPIEVQKYLSETYKKVSLGRKPTNISQYGGSIFVAFSKTETYRFNIGLYKNEVTLD